MPWREKIESLAQKEVGKTRVFLDGSRLACRMRECNLGNFITDAYIDQVSHFLHTNLLIITVNNNSNIGFINRVP